ncbi:MAG: NADH-quinone oxidoreductase subunit NuoK [Candidatus Glassbacteria bacterium]
MIGYDAFIAVGIILFGIGLAGVLFWHNILILLMSLEIMLNGVNLILVAYAAYWQQLAGQVFVLFVMLVTASEVAVALALTVLVFRHRRSLNTSLFNRMRR